MDNTSKTQCNGLKVGTERNMNCEDKEKEIPSCCLKAKVSVPEHEAKCHSTVVSGWFSQSQSSSGQSSIMLFNFFCILEFISSHTYVYVFTIIVKKNIITYFSFFCCLFLNR
jgi:hypothetical protein